MSNNYATGLQGNILVVDDTPDNLVILEGILTDAGYRVRLAPSGELALRTIATNLPDMILLDIRMPGMDGYAVCERLKADERTRTIPIIFLSALSETVDKVKGFQLGAVDYLNKPFAPEELLARVQAHLAVHALQAQLAAQNVRLQQEIFERQQTVDELQRSREHLEAVNRELQSFAYSVSHDLKAPLRGINQVVHWLVEDCREAIDAQGQAYCDLLISRVKRMEQMIDGILQYSRIGRIEGKPSPIALHALVRDIVDALAPPSQIRIDIAAELPVVIGDPIRLRQIFQNLLSNAIKFMDKPAGEIVITCQEAGDWWQFGVSDNGPGIDPQCHDRIFDLFQTGRPRDENESTGIGLTIVKKIVEWYYGNIWVESTRGQGSTFWFTFPKATAGQDALQQDV